MGRQSVQMPRIHPTFQVQLRGADSWVKGCWAYLRAKYPSLSAQPRYHSPVRFQSTHCHWARRPNPTKPQTHLRLWLKRNDSTDFELTEVLSLVCSALASSRLKTKRPLLALSGSRQLGGWFTKQAVGRNVV